MKSRGRESEREREHDNNREWDWEKKSVREILSVIVREKYEWKRERNKVLERGWDKDKMKESARECGRERQINVMIERENESMC